MLGPFRRASNARFVSSKEARYALRQIHEPFSKLEKNSPEHHELGRSGTVWEYYFQPQNSQRIGYTSLQRLFAFSTGLYYLIVSGY
jgi:hypothetical protein